MAGEQEREGEVLLDEGLGAETLGELGGLGVARLASLQHREDAAGDGCCEEDRNADQEAAQAPVGLADALRLFLGGLAALGDEPALELVELEGVVGTPVEGGGKAGAAVELARVASGRFPLGCGLGDLAA